MEAKTVEYCFDSKIYSGEDIKRKIEQIKRDFSRISNKPVEVRVELNELGMYVLTFRFYAKRSIAKMKPEKITKLYIESLGEYSNGYINKLIGNKDSEYIRVRILLSFMIGSLLFTICLHFIIKKAPRPRSAFSIVIKFRLVQTFTWYQKFGLPHRRGRARCSPAR